VKRLVAALLLAACSSSQSAGSGNSLDAATESPQDAPTDQGYPDVQPDTVEAGDSQPDTAADTPCDTQAEPQPEPAPEAGIDAPDSEDVGPDIEPDSAQPEPVVEPTPEPLPEAGPEPEPEPEPEPQPEAGPDVLEAAPDVVEVEAGSAPCPDNANMLRLPAGFCIDRTEVTRSAYAAWLQGSPPTAGQVQGCAWNSSFVPYDVPWPPGGADTYPIAGVDWCDARAFCVAHGKRLCGKIGGGPVPWTGNAYKALDVCEWYSACSSGGPYPYTYGAPYNGSACNTWDFGAAHNTTPVGSLGSCQSPDPAYSGVYDLTGNVSEWEDSCDGATGMLDFCSLRGGDTVSDATMSSCDFRLTTRRRFESSYYIGFRCCAD